MANEMGGGMAVAGIRPVNAEQQRKEHNRDMTFGRSHSLLLPRCVRKVCAKYAGQVLETCTRDRVRKVCAVYDDQVLLATCTRDRVRKVCAA